MEYRLPRPVLTQEVSKILAREMKYQLIILPKLSRKELKELAEVSESIQKTGLPKHFVCKKLPYDLGSGIFLHPEAQPLLKGTIIASYAGEVSIVVQNDADNAAYAFNPLCDIHLTKPEQALLDKKNRYHPRRLYALKVDAEIEGNFTRFINHSAKPNVIAYPFAIPANPYKLAKSPIEIVYTVKKTIRPGEQLLISYEAGEDNCYWGAFKIKPFVMVPKTFTLSSDLNLIEA